MSRIPGGYYMKARVIQNSEIMRQPPHVREIWDYCLMNANHSDKIYNGNHIKRGQLFRSYKQIRDDLAWFVGWRKETYNENQTKKAMKYLRESLMIATTKELGGVLITVCNYDTYQDPKNYERTGDGTTDSTIEEPLKNQPLPHTNKKVKNAEEGSNNETLRAHNAYAKITKSKPTPHEYLQVTALVREVGIERLLKAIDVCGDYGFYNITGVKNVLSGKWPREDKDKNEVDERYLV